MDVVCDGIVVKRQLNAASHSMRLLEQCCSVGRNVNFLQLQIVVEQNSSFVETVSLAFALSFQTQKNTQTLLGRQARYRNHVLAITSRSGKCSMQDRLGSGGERLSKPLE